MLLAVCSPHLSHLPCRVCRGMPSLMDTSSPACPAQRPECGMWDSHSAWTGSGKLQSPWAFCPWNRKQEAFKGLLSLRSHCMATAGCTAYSCWNMERPQPASGPASLSGAMCLLVPKGGHSPAEREFATALSDAAQTSTWLIPPMLSLAVRPARQTQQGSKCQNQRILLQTTSPGEKKHVLGS